MQVTLSRMRAFKLAWALFWFATGTSRVGLTIHTNQSIELFGTDRIKEV